MITLKWSVLHAGTHKNIPVTALSQDKSRSAFQVALQIQQAQAQYYYSVPEALPYFSNPSLKHLLNIVIPC